MFKLGKCPNRYEIQFNYDYINFQMNRFQLGLIRYEKRQILTECGNVMLAALYFSLKHFLKLKYYGKFTYNTQIAHSNKLWTFANHKECTLHTT